MCSGSARRIEIGPRVNPRLGERLSPRRPRSRRFSDAGPGGGFSRPEHPDSSNDGVSRDGISGFFVLNHRLVHVPDPLAVQIHEPPTRSEAIDLDALAGSEYLEDRGGESAPLSDVCPFRCPLYFAARKRGGGFGSGGGGQHCPRETGGARGPRGTRGPRGPRGTERYSRTVAIRRQAGSGWPTTLPALPGQRPERRGQTTKRPIP